MLHGVAALAGDVSSCSYVHGLESRHFINPRCACAAWVIFLTLVVPKLLLISHIVAEKKPDTHTQTKYCNLQGACVPEVISIP